MLKGQETGAPGWLSGVSVQTLGFMILGSWHEAPRRALRSAQSLCVPFPLLLPLLSVSTAHWRKEKRKEKEQETKFPLEEVISGDSLSAGIQKTLMFHDLIWFSSCSRCLSAARLLVINRCRQWSRLTPFLLSPENANRGRNFAW